MEFTKQDQNHCDNLIKALRKGTFNLEGLEVLALADAMRWLGKLQAIITAPPEKPTEAPIKVNEIKDPIQSTAPSSAPKVRSSKKHERKSN